MSKVTVPKVKGRPKGSKNKAIEVQPPIPAPDFEGAIRTLPSCLECLPGKSYFASKKGRLTNQEIIDNGLEFSHTIGSVWHYKFK